MKNILFINGCIRGAQSRTLRLARAFLEEFPGSSITELDLDRLKLAPLNSSSLEIRDKQIAAQDYSSSVFDLAREFQQADLIVIAAPFWEGTFPAMVHTYFEYVCVAGLTFEMHRTGYKGLCTAREAVYITTRGGIYSVGPAQMDDHGKAVLQTVLKTLGVSKLSMIAAEGLDIKDADIEKLLEDAEDSAKGLAQKIIKGWE